MKYALAVHTAHGETLVFPHYGTAEYLLVVAIARLQSMSSPWTEVREDGRVRARYIAGQPAPGSAASVYSDDSMSYQRHYPGLAPEQRENLRRVLAETRDIPACGDPWP